MYVSNYPELQKVLKADDKIVYLCGAGLSIAFDKRSKNWGSWLDSGKKYLNETDCAFFEKLICKNDASALTETAEFLLKTIKEQGFYNDFMNESFSVLEPLQDDLKRAFKNVSRMGDYISTTNYDLILEKATGLITVTYSSPDEMLKVLQGKSDNKILHLHGAYSSESATDDIVAGVKQYDEIIANKGAQFIQNLIGTHPLIIVGCGKTVEDPNLKGFLNFISQFVKTDVPYFYLYKNGTELDVLPENVIPVCYGNEFSDLPSFMDEITSYRIKNKLSLKDLSLVQPYTYDYKLSSAYGRLHFSNKFNPFVGRNNEFGLLNSFCDTEDKIKWWIVSGEGGVGKSRLLLEWCSKLSSSWYGFFANSRTKAEKFAELVPFSNTVVVLDYILGREKECAEIIKNLFDVFNGVNYKLRIILIERRVNDKKFNWFDKLSESMSATFNCVFKACTFGEGNPLVISALNQSEEVEYVKGYFDAYLNEVADADTKLKYSEYSPDIPSKICNSFHEKFKKEYDRPLFLSIFTEVWIYKDGMVNADSIDKLLEVYLEKEEKRWLAYFNGDQRLLYAYQKLLSLACAVEVICVNEDNGVFQEYADLLTDFIFSQKRAGKRKFSFEEIFVSEEFENKEIHNGEETIKSIFEDNELTREEKVAYAVSCGKIIPSEDEKNQKPKTFFLLQPMYPDIIRGFITDYYLDETEWCDFALTARNISTLEFGMFLIKATEDFPEKQSFRCFLIVPPENSSDLFEYYIGLLTTDMWYDSYETVENTLLDSKGTKWFHCWEVGVWNRIAENLGAEEQYGKLYVSLKKFIQYLTPRLKYKEIRETFLEVFHRYAYFIFLEGDLKKSAEITEAIDKIAADYPEDGYIATEASAEHATLIKLRRTNGVINEGFKDWSAVCRYRNAFPDDEDIAVSFAQTGSAWGSYLSVTKQEDGMRTVVSDLEKAFDKFQSQEIASELSKSYGNECNILISILDIKYIDRNREKYCLNKVTELYQKFPDNQIVASGYVVVKSEQIFGRVFNVEETTAVECSEFRKLWQLYPKEIEFAESYARVLTARCAYLYLKGQQHEARRCEKEIVKLSKRANYGDYIDSDDENIIDGMLRFLEDYVF